MTEHLAAGYRERTPSRRGERNGYYTRDLIAPAGRIAQLRVPRDREGAFLAEVFARYKRTTGEVAVRLGGGPKRTRVVGVFPGEGSLVNLAKGHGGLGFPALPGRRPALGRGRKTHRNRDLTSPVPGLGLGTEAKRLSLRPHSRTANVKRSRPRR
jgi:hypothetical protein